MPGPARLVGAVFFYEQDGGNYVVIPDRDRMDAFCFTKEARDLYANALGQTVPPPLTRMDLAEMAANPDLYPNFCAAASKLKPAFDLPWPNWKDHLDFGPPGHDDGPGLPGRPDLEDYWRQRFGKHHEENGDGDDNGCFHCSSCDWFCPGS